MAKNYDYEYIIIGSGPAGRTIATILAKSGKNVAIVEADTIGGAEICSRDLPFKVHLDFAHNFYRFSTAKASGNNEFHFNYPSLVASKNSTVAEVINTCRAELTASGVNVIEGFAHFIDPHTIAVSETTYSARYFVLATGSELKTSELSGLTSVNYYTPDTALNIRRLPQYVFVVGGGPTGTEIAEYFAMLGSHVIIMERGSHLLPREDDEVAKSITDYFTDQLGITVISSAKVIEITEDAESKIVIFTDGAGEKMVRIDCIVLATGSEPALDYGLENAGIDFKRTGITVDKYFNTSAKNIFAIGDCLGSEDSSTTRAVKEARALAENLLHRQKTPISYSGMSRSVNLYHTVTTVGLNDRDIISRDLKCKRATVYLKDISSLHGENYQADFIKLFADHQNHLLGATIVAPDSELIAGELSLAIKQKLSIETLAVNPHSVDTISTAITTAAKKLLTK